MKKNKFMRLASVMLMLCLITTCAISGTFAKYTTSAKAQDSARVAKWGITAVVTGDNAFLDDYEGTAGAGVNTVSSLGADGDSVVAPGTNGVLSTAKIYGQSEVRTNVKVEVDLDLGNNWKLADPSIVYCPIVFTVNGTEYKIDATNDTTAKLETAVENAIINLILKDGDVLDVYTSTTSIEGVTSADRDFLVNHNFGDDATDVTVNWRWDFECADDMGTPEKEDVIKDTNDTYLGDLLADLDNDNNPEVSFSLNIVVDQVD